MEDPGEYSMGNLFRGHAIIICNEKFAAGTSDRSGARKDAIKMQILFQALDFTVTTYMDVKANEMKDIIAKGSKSLANLDADCFVLAISSHGHEEASTEQSMQGDTYMYLPKDSIVWRHAVLGVDNKSVFVDEILKIFDDKEDKESFLKGKPKLFFLQACRAGHLSYRNGSLAAYDTGKDIKVSITDAKLSNIQPTDAGLYDDEFTELVNKIAGMKLSKEAENAIDCLPTDRRVKYEYLNSPVETDPNPVSPRQRFLKPSAYDIVPMPCPDDCLIMYPTVAGKYAFRSNDFGSYMFNYMFHFTHRNQLLKGCDILQYLTSVNNAMASTDIYYEPTALTAESSELQELRENLPFKMTACINHRLTKTLKFQPKKKEISVWQELKKSFNFDS